MTKRPKDGLAFLLPFKLNIFIHFFLFHFSMRKKSVSFGLIFMATNKINWQWKILRAIGASTLVVLSSHTNFHVIGEKSETVWHQNGNWDGGKTRFCAWWCIINFQLLSGTHITWMSCYMFEQFLSLSLHTHWHSTLSTHM